MRWLFPGKEVRIDANCLDCGDPMTIRMKDDDILEMNPSSAVALMSIPMREWEGITEAFN